MDSKNYSSESDSIKKINLGALTRKRDNSFLNFRENYSQLNQNIADYRYLYLLLGLMVTISSLLHYPYQVYLKKQNVSEETIINLRFIFYAPWFGKPLFGLLGDLVFPFKMKFRGWIVVILGLNIILLSLSLVFKDHVVFVTVVTGIFICSLVMLDALAQGLTAITVYFDKRKFMLEKDSIALGLADSSGSGDTGLRARAASVQYVSTYTFYFGLYTICVTLSKAVYTSISFLTNNSLDQFYWIRVCSILGCFILLPLSFNHEELQQKNWIQTKEGVQKNWKIFKEGFSSLANKENRAVVITTFFIMGLLVVNPVNYFNEKIINYFLIQEGVTTNGEIAGCTIFAGGIAVLSLLAISVRFRNITIDHYVFVAVVVMVANSCFGIAFYKEFGLENFWMKMSLIVVSQLSQIFVANLCRLCIVDIIMRKVPSSTSGSITFLACLTVFISVCQTLSKFLQTADFDQSEEMMNLYQLVWTFAVFALYLLLRHLYRDGFNNERVSLTYTY